MSGRMWGGGKSVERDKVPFLGSFGAFNDTPLAAPSGWYLSVIAGTNPSRPVFTPPTMLQDLITLPRLIKETGDYLRNPKKLLSPRQAANAHLASRFGWGPLIEDLGKLLDLQSKVLKRTKELNDLYSGKGIRRRIRFESNTAEYAGPEQWAGAVSSIATCKVTMIIKKESWGTIRWYPTSPPPYSRGDESQNQFVKRLIFGVTPEGMAKGVWDVIPWTWLLGWFTNIGRYTLVNSNTVPATHSKACFMSKVVCTRYPGAITISGTEKNNLAASGTWTKEQRTRIVSGAITPGFNMPFLGMSQLSILGSLAIQRFTR